MAASLSFIDAVVHRRTIYQLTKTSPVPDSRILELVGLAAKHLPSSFDSQTSRLVVLLGAEHDKFWDFVWDAIKPHVAGTDKEAGSKGRIDGFRGAKGSILFFESDSAVQAIASQWKSYADKFPQWSEHTSAMHQYVLWTALEAEGLGANLQHYNPIVDDRVKTEWKLDGDWQLKAQLVFGGLPEGKKREDLLMPKNVEGRDEKWVKVFGA
ncbi:Nitroreductase-like protein [Elsinoe ampelina]|uniref:Nitroreductase-like protein n=1 Tax=Elsinoe ampelina TaxID=302913 RepID=A0A6A6G8I8_9PEZI|nr:Nitroreductase-like protein [Elsinoe ampelina]